MMNDKIGATAGDIWRLLSASSGPMSVLKIKTSLGITNSAAHLALGWLSRENKIIIEEKGNVPLVSLKRQ